MPNIDVQALTDFTRDIFMRCGSEKEEAQTVAESLVLSNLKGHDSHGVIRILQYVPAVERGWIVPSAKLEVIYERDSILIVDGHWGFGQVIGREATRLAIEKTGKSGVCILTVRRSNHLGRIGEFAEMAAEAGLVTFSFTNGHGAGKLVAPYGGQERRLAANPLAAGAPLPDGSAMVMDIATSIIAEGKIKVARAKGVSLPPGCVLNGRGEPSTDPEEFYADPPGVLLPMAGHKGSALSMFVEIFAGALSGAGCSRQGVDRHGNAMLAIFLDPEVLCGEPFYNQEVGDLVGYVKSCPTMPGFDEILIPGEPEEREQARRRQTGIPIDDTTWSQIVRIAERLGASVPSV